MTIDRYLITAMICIMTNNFLYAAEYKVKSLEEEGLEVYQLTLPNGQSVDFDKKLLGQAGLLRSMLQSNERTIPISKHIIELTTTNPDEVSLIDLHTLLQVIAENPSKPVLALEKILLAEIASSKRLITLLHIARYLEIEPLYQSVKDILAQKLLKNPSNNTLKTAIAELPYDWQIDITSSVIPHNRLLQEFLSKYLVPIRTIPADSVAAMPGHRTATSLRGALWYRSKK